MAYPAVTDEYLPDRFSVMLPGGTLTETQLHEIWQGLPDIIPWADWQTIVARIGADWVVSRGDYAGTWPKRLRNCLHKEFRDSLDVPALLPLIPAIGAKYGALVNHGITYDCDLVRDFDWNAGDFGDENSCFWGNAKQGNARDRMIEDGRTCALRLYNADGDGYARCWVTRIHSSNALFVVWNAYGAPLVTFARILAHVLEYSYADCNLSNHDCVTETIYINRGRGIVLHPFSVSPRSSYDLEIDVNDSCPACGADEECPECDNCSDRTCECGHCDTCDQTRCCCQCCSHCGYNDRCNHCDRCNNCGREIGD